MPALEILFPDDAVRNLVRQAKVEQVYSVMQTGTGRGMQTMEQSLADLTLRGVISFDVALSRSSRPEQLFGLLERAGFDVSSEQSVPSIFIPRITWATLAKLDAPLILRCEWLNSCT